MQWLRSVSLLPEQTFRLSGFPAEKIRTDLLADGDCLYGDSGMDAVSGKRGADAAIGQPLPLQDVRAGAGKFHGRTDVVHIHHHPILHSLASDCKVNKP